MTKEACIKCKALTHPAEEMVLVSKLQAKIPLKRYICRACNWVWANDAQREYNRAEYDKTFELFHTPSGWY